MKVLDKREATASLAEFAELNRDEPIVVTNKGRPIAALLPIEDADLETVSLCLNPAFLDIIERSRASQRAGRTISLQEMRRRFGLAKPAAHVEQPQFWIVGAAREGSDDHYREFV